LGINTGDDSQPREKPRPGGLVAVAAEVSPTLAEVAGLSRRVGIGDVELVDPASSEITATLYYTTII